MSTASELAADFFRAREPTSTVVPMDLRERAGPSTHQRGSSEWWIERLSRAMNIRNERLQKLQSYYRGENETWRLANSAHRETFGTAFQNLRANFALPIVNVPAQRMIVTALLYPGDDAGTDHAWRMWEANDLDDTSSEAHIHVLSVGQCPIIVGQDPVDARLPLITVEDPLSVITETDPANHRTVVAGLKRWDRDDGGRIAVLYLPDRIEWWETDARIEPGRPTRWLQVADRMTRNPWGVVPIVTLTNPPRATAEHEDVLPQLDLYSKTLYDMATAADYLAFPQRYATGVTTQQEDPATDAEGNVTSVAPAAFAAGPNRVWSADEPTASFGQLPAADLSAFVRVLQELRADMATITATPHRLLVPPPTSVPPSGESVRLQDADTLTPKVRQKTKRVGNGWEQVMRLAFLVTGDSTHAARASGLQVEWAPIELHAEAEHADALSKMAAFGVPQKELWRRIGATPQQIREWEQLRSPETLTTAAMTDPQEVPSLD